MLVEVALLSIVLAGSPKRCEQGDHCFTIDSPKDSYMLTASRVPYPDVLYSKSLEIALAEDLRLVPDVRHVLVERADDNLLVWIALDNPTREVREKVFQKQFDLIDGFPEISFDFNLIAARKRTPAEFASSAKLIYSREEQ
jgi:hypothetical protein